MSDQQKEKFLQICYKRGIELDVNTKLTFEEFKEDMKGEEGKFFLKTLVDVYNLALEEAANPSYVFEPQVYNPSFHAPKDKRVVYRETILKLKIDL